MGRLSINILYPFAAIFLAVCGFSQQASAGYIAAGIGSQEDALARFASSGAGAAETTDGHRPALNLAEWEHHYAGPAGGGMTSQSVTPSSPGTAPSALPPATLPAAAQLIARLGPAGKVWLPPPFSTGIFRPPRFART